MAKDDVIIPLHDRNREIMQAAVEGCPDLRTYLEHTEAGNGYPEHYRTRNTGYAGAGLTFLLDALCSLCDPRESTVSLRRMYALDKSNRRVFLRCLQIALEER